MFWNIFFVLLGAIFGLCYPRIKRLFQIYWLDLKILWHDFITVVFSID